MRQKWTMASLAMILICVQLFAIGASAAAPESFYWVREGVFAEEPDTIPVTLYQSETQLSTGGEVIAWLPHLKPVATTREALGTPLTNPDRMECVSDTDAKYTYTFYENGVGLTYAKPGKDAGTPQFFRVDATVYQAMRQALRARFVDTPQQPRRYSAAWLTLMRESKASELTVTSGKISHTVKQTQGGFCSLFEQLQSIAVSTDGAKSFDPKKLPNTAAKISIRFRNGIVYQMRSDGKKLWLTSSDMKEGLVYDLDYGFRIEQFLNLAEHGDRENPTTGKPVIYLYPEQPTKVQVRLDYHPFTFTDPVYDNGWSVTAYPDGTLVNHADGKRYPYLFWEGDKRIDWRFDEGFVVAGSEIDAFLQEKLDYLGLLPHESVEFIDYWAPEMRLNDWNLITFAQEQYEALAPLQITPAPDSLLRVHMVYRAVAAPVAIPEQKLTPFDRKGFAAVEWGGTRA